MDLSHTLALPFALWFQSIQQKFLYISYVFGHVDCFEKFLERGRVPDVLAVNVDHFVAVPLFFENFHTILSFVLPNWRV